MRKFTPTSLVLAACACVFGSGAIAARAQTPPIDAGRDSSTENEMLLVDNPLVITAAQTRQHISNSPAAVSVITEEDIKNSGLTSVPDLLRMVPGVDVMEPNNSQSNVSIRGFNYPFLSNVLVMINGRSIYQDTFGGIFWNQEPLLISQIKQIEIVRGPGSVLYGANAMSGVINIITKSPKDAKDGEKDRVDFFTARGTQNSTVAEATYTGGERKPRGRGFIYSVGAGYRGTDGFGDLQSGKVRDSQSLPMMTLDATQFVPHGSFNIAASSASGKVDIVSPFLDLVDGTTRTNRLSADYIDDRAHLTITARTYGTSMAPHSGPTFEETGTNDFDIQQQRQPSSRHTLVYGASYRTVAETSIYTPGGSRSQQLGALYGQDEFEVAPRTHLFTGFRVDNNSIYGTNVSPRVSLVNHMDHEQTWRLSYSTAFSAPTMFDTYFNVTVPEFGVPIHLLGNTHLSAEKVDSVETGYRHDMRNGYVELSAFHNELYGPIGTILGGYMQPPGYPVPIPTTGTFGNGASATADGFEVDSRFKVTNNTQGRANYSYLNALTGGHRAELSPRNHVNVTLDSQLTSRFDSHVTMRAVDSDFVSSFTPTRMNIAPYVDYDAKLGYKIINQKQPWEISVAATNIFNIPHFELPNIPINGQPTAAPLSRQVWLEMSGGW